ncbi:MAG: ABC transporter substrate-binding protein [Rubrivivax sp.]|nr:ABC transporter substrate-binding protein [Rubrivivax sp.]MBK7262258.1 ABC transporter substrate-binding protein [Rubrivivax sp.]
MKLFRFKTLAAAAAAALLTVPALADVNVGVTISLTGPGSGLGIPEGKAFKLWPSTIAGEKINLIILDDATDPGKAVVNARRFVTEDKVDVIVGGSVTPTTAAVAPIAAESKTTQITLAPVGVPADQVHWVFRLPQSFAVMAFPLVEHMKKHGVKTVGFFGYTDGYGESWLKDFGAQAEQAGIKVVLSERFARSDTSATPQALKLVAANPDAILIAASGSAAAMPHKALIERGYKGKIYQTHGAATPDLVRIGGKDVDGSYLVSGPAVMAEQLPDSHPSKKAATDFVTTFEKAYGPGTRNQFAGHAYDAHIVLAKALPVALKKAKPGTPEFRAALRDAIEGMGRTVLAHGVINWTASDHGGYTNETGVMLKVVNGKFEVEK